MRHPVVSIRVRSSFSWSPTIHDPFAFQVQKIHDKFISEADRLKKAKESELREHRD
jgi:hypothetical protein